MAEDEIDEVPKLPPDARLGSLDERLDRLQRAEAKRVGKGQPNRAHQFGQRMAGQMIGAPAGGFLFGWGLDTLFNTKPIFMIILMFVGFGIGLRNVYYWTKNTPPADLTAGSRSAVIELERSSGGSTNRRPRRSKPARRSAAAAA